MCFNLCLRPTYIHQQGYTLYENKRLNTLTLVVVVDSTSNLKIHVFCLACEGLKVSPSRRSEGSSERIALKNVIRYVTQSWPHLGNIETLARYHQKSYTKSQYRNQMSSQGRRIVLPDYKRFELSGSISGISGAVFKDKLFFSALRLLMANEAFFWV